MKCPQCGKYSTGEFRCDYCGYELGRPVKKISMPAFLRAVFSLVIAVVIMIGAQSVVMSSYTTAVMLGQGLISESTDLSNEELINDLITKVAEQVNEQIVLILLVANLLTILVLCLINTVRRKNPAEEMYVRYVPFVRLPLFALLGMALNVFVSVTLGFIPFPESFVEGMNTQYAEFYGNHGLLIEILSVGVITGITEELIFRGIAIKKFSGVLGTRATIVISAVIFGLAHGTPIAAIYATFMGVILGYAAVSYKTVVVSIVCHVFFNVTSYILPYDNPQAIFALYIMSIAIIILCIYRLFIRRPTFYDLIFDKNGDYEYINETEAEIIGKVKRSRDAEDDMLTPEDLERLYSEWEKNRAEYRDQQKRNGKNK